MKKKKVPFALYDHNEVVAVGRNLSLSESGRRRTTTTSHIDVPAIRVADLPLHLPFEPGENESYAYDDDHIPLQPETDNGTGVKVKVTERAKRYQNSDEPLKTWMPFRDEYLDECNRLEGRGNPSARQCLGCQSIEPSFRGEATLRCEDCWGGQLFCKTCCLEQHRTHPLHRIKEWNGRYFTWVSLRHLGLQIQLNHPPGQVCQFRKPGHKDFVVLHTNGIHQVTVNFCGCAHAGEHRQQLMRASWWPATPLEPQTCATFNLLRLFHIISLQSKTSGFDMYRSIEYLTENFGLRHLPDRLPALMIMLREWRHIKMLKRGGRGHDPTGVYGTKQGELAVLCRACPIPGVNLPDGWQNAPPETAFIYWLVVCEDACFRFKNKLRSSETKDPTLGPGFAYFVEHGLYSEYIKLFVDQVEISTCSGFAAMHLDNLKGITGHRTSGVGGVCCARQDVWRPNGLGDLQKGERFCNMDYIFLSAISGVAILTILASYDIACQWLIHFWARVITIPARLQPTIAPNSLKAKIPKFHFDAHGKKNHAQYSFSYTRGAGRSDGEGIERCWSSLKGGAAQTTEMGPGARRDTLDDFCGWSNWRKMVDIGNSLLRKLVEAMTQAVEHRRAFDEFDQNLRAERPQEVEAWEKEYEEWDREPKGSPCIFDTTDPGVTMSQVRLQLANEEAAKTFSSANSPHSAAAFLMLGLDIEESQRTLYLDVKEKKSPTALQIANFQERRIALRKKIQHLRTLQTEFMSGLRSVLRTPTVLDDSPDILAENIRLYLPSELSSADRDRACAAGVADAEARIRHADASEALDDLRRYLRTRTCLNKWRVKNVVGQHQGTRSRVLQHRTDIKVQAAKTRYKHARNALLILRGPGEWELTLQVLQDGDVRALNERELTLREKEQRDFRTANGNRLADDSREGVAVEGTLGEGRRMLSWIWMTVSTDENSAEMHDALRVEWAKCKARAARWQEEIMILLEEMRRVDAFSKWKADWWENQQERRDNVDPLLSEGLCAYAQEHADNERAFAVTLGLKWGKVKERAQSILIDLASQYLPDDDQHPVPIDAEFTIDGDYDDEFNYYQV